MDRYQSLVPILPFQLGVCSFCHQGTFNESRICNSCAHHGEKLGLEFNEHGRTRIAKGSPTAIAMCLPLFLRIHSGTGHYRAGWEYKKEGMDAATQRDAQQFMTSILKMGLRHEDCLISHLRVPSKEFDLVTWIPSKAGRVGTHPLESIVRGVTESRVKDIFSHSGGPVPKHYAHDSRQNMWKLNPEVRLSKSILVIDDLWTSGASLLSAAYALLSAGVERVGLLPIGRHMNPHGQGWSPGRAFEDFSTSLKWDNRFCALCDTRDSMHANPDLLTQYRNVKTVHKDFESKITDVGQDNEKLKKPPF